MTDKKTISISELSPEEQAECFKNGTTDCYGFFLRATTDAVKRAQQSAGDDYYAPLVAVICAHTYLEGLYNRLADDAEFSSGGGLKFYEKYESLLHSIFSKYFSATVKTDLTHLTNLRNSLVHNNSGLLAVNARYDIHVVLHGGDRTNKSEHAAMIVYVAKDQPIDQFLVHRPEFLLNAPIEQAWLSADNPYIILQHLPCAAYEHPLRCKLGRIHSLADGCGISDNTYRCV